MAGKFFPIISLALSRGNPLWGMGLIACKENNENLFLSYCKLDVDKLRPLGKLSVLPANKAANKQTKTKMKTKEKKSIQSAIQLPSGLQFTSKRDFAETLFHPLDGKTAFGYYTFHKSKKHGTQSIRLRRANGELFALILSNGWNATARTAWEENGKVFNLYGLTDEGRKLIGTEETQSLIEIVNRAAAINTRK